MFTWSKTLLLLAGLRRFFRLLEQNSALSFALTFTIGISLSLVISACAAGPFASSDKVVRIGHQKFGTLSILRAQGTLEKSLKSQGISIRWNQFPAGPQLLEALNAGQLDFGHTGETPPIMAQAAGAPLLYVASEPPNPQGEAILVPQDSPIRNIADLQDKKVALNKGSNVHYLVVQALEKAGLKYSNIQPVFLPPADARLAFERKKVDAWAIWDPYFAAAQQATAVRILQDGQGIVANREFFLASQSFAKRYPERLQTVLAEIKKVDAWAAPRPREVANLLSPLISVDARVLEQTARRRPYGVESITEEVVAYQQQVADKFFRLKLVPKKLDVKQVAPISKQSVRRAT